MKRCSQCKTEYKDIESNFSKDKRAKNGYCFACKKCYSKYIKEYKERPEAKERIKVYQKDYIKQWKKENTEKTSITMKKYYKNNPEKTKCRNIYTTALKNKSLTKPVFCSNYPFSNVCEGTIHGHHKDYTKPLDVIWLCKKCHTELHNKLKR